MVDSRLLISSVALTLLGPGCYTSIDPVAEAWDGRDGWHEVYAPFADHEVRTWKNDDDELTAEIVEGVVVVEGDIVIGTVEQVDEMFATGDLTFRGVGRDSRLWNMPVKYSFANSVDDELRADIELALDRLVDESVAKISFEECSGLCAGSHLKFKVPSDGGCSSPVGRVPWPAINKIRIGEGCGVGSIMHEVMHSLGVHHEQSRCDRDQFVTIHEDAIIKGRQSNFKRKCAGNTDYGDYDYASIMHYPDWAFGRDGMNTITALDPAAQDVMGNRSGLSLGDRIVLTSLYGHASVGGTPPGNGPTQECEESECQESCGGPGTGTCGNGDTCDCF